MIVGEIECYFVDVLVELLIMSHSEFVKNHSLLFKEWKHSFFSISDTIDWSYSTNCKCYAQGQNKNNIPQRLLSFSVYCYAQDIRNKVICQKIKRGRKLVRGKVDNDYPAVVVSCMMKGGQNIEYGRSFVCNVLPQRINANQFEDVLKNRLLQLGTLNEPTKSCKNKLGYCAENHAANKLIKNMVEKSKVNFDNIIFSIALRPRTLEPQAYCSNCQKVFPYCKQNNSLNCDCNNKKCLTIKKIYEI